MVKLTKYVLIATIITLSTCAPYVIITNAIRTSNYWTLLYLIWVIALIIFCIALLAEVRSRNESSN